MSESEALEGRWTWCRLSDLAEYITSGSRDWSRYYADAGPLFVRTQDINTDSLDLSGVAHVTLPSRVEGRRTLLSPGDILITITGANVGKCAVVPTSIPEAYVSQSVALVRLADPGLARYVYFALRTASRGSRTALQHMSYGIGRPVLNLDNVGNAPVPLAPRREQRRIIQALESYFTRLDAAVATLERVQRNLKRYRSSVLKAAVEGRLVPTEAELARAEGRDYEPASALLERILTERRRRWEEAELAKMAAKGKVPKDDRWKERYEEPAAPDLEGLPELPEGWCWATLPQLGEVSRGKSTHRPRNDPRLLEGPYPFIQTGDIRSSGGSITRYSNSYSEFGLAQSRLWPSGTLCITIAANIAETGILTFPACFPDSVVGFLCEDDPTRVRFLELFFRTAKQELARFAPATAQKNINLETLRGLAVPLPPAEEQARIVREVDQFDTAAISSEATVSLTFLRLTRLRQSILKWAFEGRLVDQDPDDEPASVLLERIRAEREAATATRKRGTRRPRAKASQP